MKGAASKCSLTPPLRKEQTMAEVQKHGFVWEKELLHNVYGATAEELKALNYTSKMDLPSTLNRLNGVDLSIKCSSSANAVCMADCLRVFDAVNSGKPLHMTVVFYKQDDARNVKKVVRIVEVDLTGATAALFGSVTRKQIEELDAAVKAVPQRRAPTPEEYARMYALRDTLQPLSKAIHFDIKCNSQQSRLQCSFNRFQAFLEENPSRVIAQGTSQGFHGKTIVEEVASGRRVFKARAAPAAPN